MAVLDMVARQDSGACDEGEVWTELHIIARSLSLSSAFSLLQPRFFIAKDLISSNRQLLPVEDMNVTYGVLRGFMKQPKADG